ncbi:MAG: membrane protein FxsA [Chloroflexi bacterium]|nr:MAG: membrane protein FxsA [Chloroflexota bacterium]
MLSRLLLLFIVVPAVELLLLIQMGRWIGTLPTVGLIVVTGIVGAYLTRQQGVQVWRRAQHEVQNGQVPGSALLEGAMILVAGAVLMTPGVLTDAFGFLLLIPQTRKLLRGVVWRQFQRILEKGQIRVGGFSPMNARQGSRPTIIIDPEETE